MLKTEMHVFVAIMDLSFCHLKFFVKTFRQSGMTIFKCLWLENVAYMKVCDVIVKSIGSKICIIIAIIMHMVTNATEYGLFYVMSYIHLDRSNYQAHACKFKVGILNISVVPSN